MSASSSNSTQRKTRKERSRYIYDLLEHLHGRNHRCAADLAYQDISGRDLMKVNPLPPRLRCQNIFWVSIQYPSMFLPTYVRVMYMFAQLGLILAQTT